MALYAKDEGGKDFDPVSAGIHVAICTAVYDLGTQFNERFNKSARKALIQWELPDHRITIQDKDGGGDLDLPRAISKIYTLSLYEKANLRKELEGWRGKSFTDEELSGFDLLKLLGVCCQIQIIHKKTEKKTYANITSVFPLPKDQWREPENPLRSFSFDDGGELPEGIPDWIKNIICGSDEWELKKYNSYDPAGRDDPPPNDDIPF